MTNNEIIQCRVSEMFANMQQQMQSFPEGYRDSDILASAAAIMCDGCDKCYPVEETDFTFWKLGPPDYCPACWS